MWFLHFTRANVLIWKLYSGRNEKKYGVVSSTLSHIISVKSYLLRSSRYRIEFDGFLLKKLKTQRHRQ